MKTLLQIVCTGAMAILLLACTQENETSIQDNRSVETGTVTNPFCNSGESLPGGWHEAEIDDEANDALNSVLQRMNTAAGLESILAVRTQIVAGKNYAIDFRLDNGEVWNTRVFRDLQGNFEMTQPARRGSMMDACE